MRFARLLALSLGVLAVSVGGAFLLAPPASGQAKRIVVGPSDDVRVFGLGGSRLGISIRDVDQADVTREKLTGQTGAVVEEVSSDSPAAKAGLKSGDVVVSFDGERVRSARQLERLVGETPAGRSVKMTVQRGGSRLDLDVTPEASAGSWIGGGDMWRAEREAGRLAPRIEQDLRRRFPAMEFNWDGDATWMLPGGRGRLGVAVQDMSEQLAGYFGVKTGVLVTDVDADSPAAKAGIQAGDVITAVNGQTVDGPDELRREVSKVEDGSAADVSVTRDKKTLSLKVNVENPERKIERRTRRTV
jgi:serine protease Do